jgi:peptide chain release factor subunit 1
VVIALVDSNTARLFVTRIGFLEEVGGPDDDSVHYQKRSMGGWSQARYQRHIDKHRADFAREVAREIEQLADEEAAVRLVLAGDEVAIPPLRAALSSRMLELVEGDPLRIHIRAPRDAVRDQVEELLARAEAGDARVLADQLVGEVRSGGLGVAGPERTRAALEYGQADLLLLAPDAELDEATRDEYIRLAARSGAGVEVVADHATFEQLGGVGALLRYRLPPAEPMPAGVDQKSSPRL